jgi:hypothetical protein
MKKIATIIALASQMGYNTDSFGADANTLVSATKAAAHAKSLSFIDALAKSEQELYEKTDLDRFITTARRPLKKKAPPKKPVLPPTEEDEDDDDEDKDDVQTAEQESEEIS